jgi:hypothetical protein
MNSLTRCHAERSEPSAVVSEISASGVTRSERTNIESGCSLGSMNNVESALPSRIREEIHQNVADPRELVAESCLFKLWLSGLE